MRNKGKKIDRTSYPSDKESVLQVLEDETEYMTPLLDDDEYFKQMLHFLKKDNVSKLNGIYKYEVLGRLCGNDFITGAILEVILVKGAYYREVELPSKIHKRFLISSRSADRKLLVIEALPFITKIRNSYKNRRTYLINVELMVKMYRECKECIG